MPTWRQADLPTAAVNVCCWGKREHHAQMSPCPRPRSFVDPERIEESPAIQFIVLGRHSRDHRLIKPLTDEIGARLEDAAALVDGFVGTPGYSVQADRFVPNQRLVVRCGM